MDSSTKAGSTSIESKLNDETLLRGSQALERKTAAPVSTGGGKIPKSGEQVRLGIPSCPSFFTDGFIFLTGALGGDGKGVISPKSMRTACAESPTLFIPWPRQLDNGALPP